MQQGPVLADRSLQVQNPRLRAPLIELGLIVAKPEWLCTTFGRGLGRARPKVGQLQSIQCDSGSLGRPTTARSPVVDPPLFKPWAQGSTSRHTWRREGLSEHAHVSAAGWRVKLGLARPRVDMSDRQPPGVHGKGGQAHDSFCLGRQIHRMSLGVDSVPLCPCSRNLSKRRAPLPRRRCRTPTTDSSGLEFERAGSWAASLVVASSSHRHAASLRRQVPAQPVLASTTSEARRQKQHRLLRRPLRRLRRISPLCHDRPGSRGARATARGIEEAPSAPAMKDGVAAGLVVPCRYPPLSTETQSADGSVIATGQLPACYPVAIGDR
jgi:hypothetical protein